MATSKEIELKLQVLLEQGNAIENAKSLGLGISSAIETAFNGLGERIAANLILQMQGVLSNFKFSDVFANNQQSISQLQQNASFGNGMLSQPTYQTSGGIHIFSRMDSRLPPPAPGGSPVAGGTHETSPLSLAQEARSSGIGAPQRSNGSDYFFRTDYGLGYASRPAEFMGIKGASGAQFSNIQLAELDRTREDLRNFQRYKKLDPDARMDEDLKTRLASGVTTVKDIGKQEKLELDTLNRSIAELVAVNKELKNNLAAYEQELSAKVLPESRQEHINKGVAISEVDTTTGQTRTVFKSAAEVQNTIAANDQKESSARTRVGIIGANTDAGAGFVKDAANALDAEKRQGFMFSPKLLSGLNVAGGAFHMLGQAASAYGQRNMFLTREQAARYSFQNKEADALLNNNFGEAMAIQLAGGDEAVKKQANRDTNISAGADILGGIGAGLVGVGAGIAAIPAAGATLGIGGVAMGAVSAGSLTAAGSMFKSGFGKLFYGDQEAEQRQSEYISQALKNNKIALQAAQRTRSRAIQSFDIAQSMGDKNLSQDIYGAAPTPETPASSPWSRLPEEQRAAYRAEMKEIGMKSFLEKHVGEGKDLPKGFMGIDVQASGTNFGENSPLYKASKKYNMSAQQYTEFASGMASWAGSGNPYSDKESERYPMRSPAITANYDKSMELYGKGYTNIYQVAGTLFQDRVSDQYQAPGARVNSVLGSTNKLFEDAERAGISHQNVSESVNTMAARVAESGYGSEEYETRNFQRGLSAAKGMFGEQNMTAANVRAATESQNKLMDVGRGSDTLAVMAGVQRVDKLNKDKSLQEEYEYKDKKTGKMVKGKRNLQLDTMDEMYMREFKGDAKSLMEFYNSKEGGGKIDEATAKKMLEKYEDSMLTSQQDVRKWMGKRGAEVSLAHATGAKTMQQSRQNVKNVDEQKNQQQYTEAVESWRIPMAAVDVHDPRNAQGTYDASGKRTGDAATPKGTADTKQAVGEGEKRQETTMEAEQLAKGFGLLKTATDKLENRFNEVHTSMEKFLKFNGSNGGVFGVGSDSGSDAPAGPGTPSS